MSDELPDGFETKKCFECDGKMNPIRVIAGMRADLTYSSVEATQSWFTSYYKEAGTLTAYLCTKCGAVRFYALPSKNS